MVAISILVPVYNVEKYLERCIESILSQDFYDYEIILVDDGSPDNSGKICDEFRLKYPERIRVIHKKNGGLITARQYGVNVARGKYLMFVDSDDIILPNAIRTLFYYIEKGNYDVVRGNAYRFTNKNKIFPLEKYVFEKGEIKTNSEYVKKMYLGDTAPYLWGAIYKSELFDNTTYEETIKHKISICEDWVTNLIISRKINRALYVTDYVYGYFFNDESIMSTCIMSRNYQHKIQIILDNYNIFNHYSTQSVRYVRRAKEIIVNFFVPELGYDEYEYKELLNILDNKSFKDVIYSSMPKKFLLFLKYPIFYRIYSKIYCLLLFIIRFKCHKRKIL